jgi:hypothetical protein
VRPSFPRRSIDPLRTQESLCVSTPREVAPEINSSLSAQVCIHIHLANRFAILCFNKKLILCNHAESLWIFFFLALLVSRPLRDLATCRRREGRPAEMTVPSANTSRTRVSSRSRNGNTTGARDAAERTTINNNTQHYPHQAAGNNAYPRRDFSMDTRRVITDVMSPVVTNNFTSPLSLFSF